MGQLSWLLIFPPLPKLSCKPIPASSFWTPLLAKAGTNGEMGLAEQTPPNSCFSFSAHLILSPLPVFRPCSSGSWRWLWLERRMRDNLSGKDILLSGCHCVLWELWALSLPYLKDCRCFRWRFWPVSVFPSTWAIMYGSLERTISLSMAARLRFRLQTRMSPNIRQ